ncbi:MAG: carbohydrate kinase family protein [Candidatus Nanoarchaeia archaeon]
MTTEAELVKVPMQGRGNSNRKETLLAYPLGAKILVKDIHFETGGGGTNTAVSFSRLGLKTAYLGKIGRDNNGVQVYHLLHKENIHFLGSFGNHTGYSVILDSEASDRTILTFKGCNDDFKFTEIKKKELKTKWFYLCSMTNHSLKALIECAKFAAKQKIRVAFNPSIYLVKKGIRPLIPILKNTNVLVLNKEEAETLSGKKNIDEMMLLLKKIIKDYVVITDGGKGCWCFDGKKMIHMSPKKNARVIETTGAGDAFASAFTAGIINKRDVLSSLKMGMIQSESIIQHKGAKNILLDYKKMESILKLDKRKITERTLKR